jgi:hypothetical protein
MKEGINANVHAHIPTTFQGLHVVASQNQEIPIAGVKEYLARHLEVFESSRRKEEVTSVLSQNALDGKKTPLSRNVATTIASEKHCPRVSAPDESGDDSSLTSEGSSNGSEC